MLLLFEEGDIIKIREKRKKRHEKRKKRHEKLQKQKRGEKKKSKRRFGSPKAKTIFHEHYSTYSIGSSRVRIKSKKETSCLKSRCVNCTICDLLSLWSLALSSQTPFTEPRPRKMGLLIKSRLGTVGNPIGSRHILLFDNGESSA